MKLIRNLNKTIKIIISFIGLVIVGICYAIMQAINLVFWIPVALLNNMRYRVVRSSIIITICLVFLRFYKESEVFFYKKYSTSWNKMPVSQKITRYFDILITGIKNMNMNDLLKFVVTFLIIVIAINLLIKTLYGLFSSIDQEVYILKSSSASYALAFLDEITHSFSVIAYGTKKERDAAELLEFRKKYGPFETITDLLEKQTKIEDI